MALNAHEIANSNDDLLDLLSQLTSGGQNEGLTLLDVRVDLLKNGDGKSGGLASTRLGLRNNIVTCSELVLLRGASDSRMAGCFRTLNDWHDGALLDSRRALETIRIDTCDRWIVSLDKNSRKVATRLRASMRGRGTRNLPRRSSGRRFISSKESTVSS
jgi:hypothetical protein